MKAKVYLQIAEPCHEDWDAMSPVQQGRYCNSCCKQVVDFSQMSDKEILQILTKAAGNTCGRFKADQLERPLIREIPYSLRPYKFFLSAFIPALVITGSAMSQDRLQGKVAVRPGQISASTIKGDTVYTAGVYSKLKGRVTFEDGTPATGASIKIKGTKKGISADLNGDFLFGNIPATGKIKLEIMYVGYEPKEVVIDRTKQHQVEIKLMDSDRSLMGEVVVFAGMVSTKTVDEEEFIPTEKPGRKASICGQVVDATGQPLPYANITLTNSKKGVTADGSGNFKLPIKHKGKSADISASYAGYEPVNKQVSFNNDDTAKIIITLSQSKKLPDALVTSYATSCRVFRMGGISIGVPVTLADTAKAMTAKLFKNEMFKVYPNPVVKGSEAQVVFKQPGNYTLRLLDNSGKLYQSQNLTVSFSKQPVSIKIPGNLSPGNYFLKAVSMQTNKQFTDKIVIQ